MSGAGALLLAVADEPRNAALLEAILGRAGYRLAVVGDLAEARTLLASITPNLVLLDRHLPDGDGLDLIDTIREDDRLRHVPILLVSASVLPRDQRAALEAGCDGFIAKPVRVKPLVDEVRRLLDEGAAARPS
ncbi:MAG TPA: response regulator [Candidatus Limnocylindria bacterium]|nr:response regulator [Candidatus Limnocylindria bacterium]